ncbi:MAG: DUF5067 domain-containing protein [Lachnospiraceae bacterium]|nr:DUF5067 domain-containing protein [Lachnospiraceae bacterium]
MPRDLDLDFEFQDEEVSRPRPARPRRPEHPAGRTPSRGGASSRRRKTDTTSIIILIVEIVVFVALLGLFIFLKGKLVDEGGSSSSSASTQESGSTSNGVNVESQDFSLTCTKVQLVMDADNETAALVYFTFVNKTDTPLAMSAVFPASVKQNGADCPEDTNLADVPAEIANKDMQVSGGQSVECCYAFKLSDQTSPLTLTVHDNYSTFTDIGSTEIPIS